MLCFKDVNIYDGSFMCIDELILMLNKSSICLRKDYISQCQRMIVALAGAYGSRSKHS